MLRAIKETPVLCSAVSGTRRFLPRTCGNEPKRKGVPCSAGVFSSAQAETVSASAGCSRVNEPQRTREIHAANTPDKVGRYTGKLPGILCITPYGKAHAWKEARKFATRGYVVMIVDSRGRFDSEGAFDPFDPRFKTDRYYLVEWMAGQSLSRFVRC